MTGLLDGVDLVVFDKDGTLIEFHAMWGTWATGLAHDLAAATGRDVRPALFALFGYDEASGRVLAHGRLAATPMARLRDLTAASLVELGIDDATVASAMAAAWHAPDPVALARPVTDLPALLGAVRRGGRRVAIATTDDRAPTLRTVAAFGIAGLVDAMVCADDGTAPKPAPDMVVRLCAELGVPPSRTAVIGDSIADLEMGRAAGVARRYGVLTGVGTRADLAPLADSVLESVEDLIDR